MTDAKDMEGELRFLVPEDLEALLELYQHLHEEAPPAAADAQRVWATATESQALVYVGVFIGGRLVSSCNAAVIPNLTRGSRPYAVIENVVTHPKYRGRGFASACLKALRDHCLERRCYKLMLLSSAEREQAHRLYASVGFDPDVKRGFVLRAQR